MSQALGEVDLIAFDVDGTLTDGGLYFGEGGEEHKRFDIADGLGFRLALLAGLRVGIISGRSGGSVTARMKALGVTDVMLGVGDKAQALTALANRFRTPLARVAYVGDDLNDIPAFEIAGVKIAVANAVDEVKMRADYVTVLSGGHGAGREAIEAVLRAGGRYEQAVSAYLKELHA